MLHHVSLKTAHIHRAIAFYEVFGFTVQERFTTGYTLACWLTGVLGRLELIQVPEPQPTADAFGDEHYVGYYHLSFDVTEQAESLPVWLANYQRIFSAKHQADPDLYPPLRVLLEPCQQMIGDRVYEVCFIADGDGLPLEFIRCLPPV